MPENVKGNQKFYTIHSIPLVIASFAAVCHSKEGMAADAVGSHQLEANARPLHWLMTMMETI